MYDGDVSVVCLWHSIATQHVPCMNMNPSFYHILQDHSNINEIIKSALGFNVYRKDRPNKSYAGVLIAVTNDLISSVVTDLDTDCEILWVQIDLIGTKSLHIGSFYRPPNSDMTALDNLNLSLERLTHRTNGNIWLGGDFNAPNIDCSSMEVSPMAGGRRQEQQRLIDISLDHNIEQTIDKPTSWGGNSLDLLFTNNKSTLTGCALLIVKYLYFGKQTGTELNGN